MKITITIAIAALVAASAGDALATGDRARHRSKQPAERIDSGVRANAAAWSAANAAATSNAAQQQGQQQGQQQTLTNHNTLTAALHGAPATASVNVAGDRLQAPALGLGNTYPTSPCMGSSQVGGSGVGFSVGIGTSWTDDECGIRETARSFDSLGLKADAVKVLCASKYAASAPVCQEARQ